MSETEIKTIKCPALSLRGPLRPYNHPQETKEELSWADLTVLDLSLWDQPGGKEELAHTLEQAIQDIGFFYITNIGLSQDQIDHVFAVARDIFDLPQDEKLKFKANIEKEGYPGYKPPGGREIAPGVFDNTELYSFAKFIPGYLRRQPAFVEEHRSEIEQLSRHMHETGRKLMVLMAMILELPETYFSDRHRYESKSECNLRFMKYGRLPQRTIDGLGSSPLLRGHTDFGSLTMLFRQPVAGLQVQTPNGDWKHVRPHPGSVTVNIADCLDFMSGGYLKSSIHRVARAPVDQLHHDRIGIVYFMRPEDDVKLDVVDSPLVKGSKSRLGSADGVTAGEWCKTRTKNNTRKSLVERNAPLIINGIEVKSYGQR